MGEGNEMTAQDQQKREEKLPEESQEPGNNWTGIDPALPFPEAKQSPDKQPPTASKIHRIPR